SSAEAYEQFYEKIVEEERKLTQELLSETHVDADEKDSAEEAQERLVFGYEIKDQPVPIQDIQDEERKAIIQGTVFQLDVKELRNGNTLFTFSITDFTDSLQCKCFAKSKEDVKILNRLSVGMWVRVRGRVEYDR